MSERAVFSPMSFRRKENAVEWLEHHGYRRNPQRPEEWWHRDEVAILSFRFGLYELDFHDKS